MPNVITYIENILYKRGASDTSFPSKFNMRGCYFLLVYFCLLFSVRGLHFRKYMWVDKTQCLKLIEKVSFNIASKTFWVDKSSLKLSKIGDFWKTEVSGQIVLPDKSILIGRDEILGIWEFGNPEISHLF